MFERPISLRFLTLCATYLLVPSLVSAQERAPIPEDLLADDHVREEFGVNMFTAPSIEKIFETLNALGDLPYDKLSRKLPENPPKERAVAALSMGTLIADGFLSVQCEQRGDLEPIGRSLLDHAETLGADKRMNRHTKGLLEHSLSGDWNKLKTELAATQSDVEAELVLLRDVNIANLIALGGWLRAFQIATLALEASFDEEKTKTIMRTDVAEYFVGESEYLEPEGISSEKVKQLHVDLVKLREEMEPDSSGKYTKVQISHLNEHVTQLLARLLSPSPQKKED